MKFVFSTYFHSEDINSVFLYEVPINIKPKFWLQFDEDAFTAMFFFFKKKKIILQKWIVLLHLLPHVRPLLIYYNPTHLLMGL